jgi:hypothetical protein
MAEGADWCLSGKERKSRKKKLKRIQKSYFI